MTADFVVPIKMSERANYERVLRAARALIRYVRETRSIPSEEKFKCSRLQELEDSVKPFG